MAFVYYLVMELDGFVAYHGRRRQVAEAMRDCPAIPAVLGVGLTLREAYRMAHALARAERRRLLQLEEAA